MGDEVRGRIYQAEYTKRISDCKDWRCKGKIEIGSLRLSRIVETPFYRHSPTMTLHYHQKCMFETFKRSRPTTRVIESADEISNFDNLKEIDKISIRKFIKELNELRSSISPKELTPVKSKSDASPTTSAAAAKSDDSTGIEVDSEENEPDVQYAIKFETFQQICDSISATSSHLQKTDILTKFFESQKNISNFTENAYIFYKLLLPTSVDRVFFLDNKQLLKLFSQLFDTDLDEMNQHFNKQGDVSETIVHYFKLSNGVKSSASSSQLTCAEIDLYLTNLTKVSDLVVYLTTIVPKMTPLDLRMFVRLIKKDLKIDAGHKKIFDSISPNAYQAYQASRDLKDVIERGFQKPGQLKKDISIRFNLMTPVEPMLAEACKSAEQAFGKFTNGILAEFKYDGERLQVHKNGDTFAYFGRNVKQVSEHKTEHIKDYIPKAMLGADQLILDGEILLYDTKNKCPLPFGTLVKHKNNEFKDATVCYFVFDCLYYNGESLMNKSMKERREILEKNVKEIPGRIMLSEQKLITEPEKLKSVMMDAIKKGLEGLVLKDTKSIYEPGKRHWLKMKKDYLESCSMVDTVDLVVLGAYYGKGVKGGMKSTFLMGCLNENTKKWHTVTKVANGFDNKTLESLQKSIDMVEIKKKESSVPDWLVINKTLIPDFVVKNVEKSPVWEITGAEFSKSDKHTANGISIRFPRVTKQRHDKSWKEATSLQRLKDLFDISKQKSDINDNDQKMEDDDDIEIIEVIKPSLKRKTTKKKLDIESSDDESDKENAGCNKKLKSIQVGKLPDIFENKTFCLSPDVPQAKELRRYIFAYGGEVVDGKLADKAIHVVLNNSSDNMPDLKKGKKGKKGTKVEKITHDQLWKAIERQKF